MFMLTIMNCPYCNASSSVTNSRSHNNLEVWRRRKCSSCSSIWTTRELIDFSTSHRIIHPSNTPPEHLERDQILFMVSDSLRHHSSAQAASSALTDTVLARVLALNTPEIPLESLHSIVHEVLEAFDPTSAAVFKAKYS